MRLQAMTSIVELSDMARIKINAKSKHEATEKSRIFMHGKVATDISRPLNILELNS